jgi:hypothetical protein
MQVIASPSLGEVSRHSARRRPSVATNSSFLPVAADEHAVDRVAAVLAGGGEERPADEVDERARLDGEGGGVLGDRHEARDLREVLGLEAAELEVGVGAADVGRVALDLEGERGLVLLGAHDLGQLVGGDERLARLLDVDPLGEQGHRELGVGRLEHELPRLAVLGGGQLDTLELGAGRAVRDHA